MKRGKEWIACVGEHFVADAAGVFGAVTAKFAESQ